MELDKCLIVGAKLFNYSSLHFSRFLVNWPWKYCYWKYPWLYSASIDYEVQYRFAILGKRKHLSPSACPVFCQLSAVIIIANCWFFISIRHKNSSHSVIIRQSGYGVRPIYKFSKLSVCHCSFIFPRKFVVDLFIRISSAWPIGHWVWGQFANFRGTTILPWQSLSLNDL